MARILIADDDPLICGFMRQTLELVGYEVTAANDGAEAIRALHDGGSFDLTITDYAMPFANGIEVITQSQRIDASVPCIIVTAYRDLELAMQGMQAGAVGFIPKPFKADHLRTVVQRALERHDLARETLWLRALAPMLERFTAVLANVLETKDVNTQRHSERLMKFADATAMVLGLSDNERGGIRLGACLHDIGKVGVPEYLLTKPGPLTPPEREIMQQHPEIGASIIEDVDTWQDVRDIVRHHHEQFNGTGYPRGLTGSAIPLGARIVSVVDAFDVMRNGRPYSTAKPPDEIVAELRGQAGRQFDPDMVGAFLATEPFLKTVDTVDSVILDGRAIPRQAESLTNES